MHDSIIHEPDDTTCKYLHRKDLPRFIVGEGLSEHAAEYAKFSNLVSLSRQTPIQRGNYSEKQAWKSGSFDSITNALSQYHRTERAWVFIESFSGGVDGRRSLTCLSLIRRFMVTCGTWTSSYRLILANLQDLSERPCFSDDDLNSNDKESIEAIREEALWEVVFARIAGIQEYGFHAGLEELMWATDSLGEALASFDWTVLSLSLQEKKHSWTDLVIKHATDEGVFFQSPDRLEVTNPEIAD